MGEILLDKAKFEKIVQYITITWIEQCGFLYQYGGKGYGIDFGEIQSVDVER